MKQLIKKVTPGFIFPLYHKSMAILANLYYRRPSEELIVIGVTGTNGKSSTVNLIARILEEAGYKVGATATNLFKIADREWVNDKKMTMLGRFALQGLLRKMVKAGCAYAVIETSSQGVEQFRHLGIHYDACVFTNLTPEHIEAHGGFENYKKAKLKLFKHLEKLSNKSFRKKLIPKAIIVNGDDEHAKDFLDFRVDKKIAYSVTSYQLPVTSGLQKISAENIEYGVSGISFEVNDVKFNIHLFGQFNIYNALAAITTAISQGINLETCKTALEKVKGVPGRMEFIEEGSGDQAFTVVVDYGYEPEGLRQVFKTIKDHKLVLENGRIIHVFGSCGGGRDVSRRPIMGKLSAENADICIVANEDPYDDDPLEIIEQVAKGAEEAGKILNENLFKIMDRREAINFAISLAKPGDLVLLTGKGNEQVICVANDQKIKWDEREVAREELRKIKTLTR